jgi:hypothetical protein
VEALDVVEQVGLCFDQGQVTTPMHPLALELAEEALGRGVSATVTNVAHAADDVLVLQKLLALGTGELGGFNGSSQNLNRGGVSWGDLRDGCCG